MLLALAQTLRSAYDALTEPKPAEKARARDVMRRLDEIERQVDEMAGRQAEYRIDMAALADKAEEVLDRAAARQARASAQEGRVKAREEKVQPDPEDELDSLMQSDPETYRSLMKARGGVQ